MSQRCMTDVAERYSDKLAAVSQDLSGQKISAVAALRVFAMQARCSEVMLTFPFLRYAFSKSWSVPRLP